ncbi:MAG: PQQ-dependent sugar dehydrogenase [Wenzhouxiangellaceae bacterium]
MKFLFLVALFVFAGSTVAQVPDDVSLEAVPGISGLNSPLGLKPAVDGSGRIFIVEQGGTVRVIDDDGNLLATPFVDLGNRVDCCGERGLLDIAFHPNHSANGLFYLHYSAGSNRPAGTASGDTIVAEFSLTGDPNVGNSTPERIILTVTQDFANHNGGQMRFGPDGYLYLGLGDGGSGGDPCNRAQTLDPADLLEPNEGACPDSAAALDPSRALLGKMLRVDVDDTTPASGNNLCAASGDGSAEYTVPADNPFAGEGNRCGEVFLYGLRNPWRWSFDRATDDLWIGDVGQNQWEEIDLLEAPLTGADNLGWNCFEGSSTFSTGNDCPPSSPVFPVLEYDHVSTGGCSVTGGYRYRGPVSSLQGFYIYGDFCSGDIWFADNDSGNWQTTLTDFNVGNIRSFGEDDQGNVHVIAGNDLFRFEGNTDLLFADGFETP